VTTPHPFAALLRTLDAEASKAPFTVDTVPTSVGICHKVGPLAGGVPACIYVDDRNWKHAVALKADATMFVTLRNAAPEVAALVEAAWQIKAHNYPPDESGHYGELGSIDGDMLFAALDALAAKAKEDK